MDKTRLRRKRTFKPGQVRNALQDALNEIDLMKEFQHPNIIQLKEVMDESNSDKIVLGNR